MPPTPYLDTLRWEAVKNTSGEVCPAFGLLAVTGTEMRGDTYKRPVITCTKPSTTFYIEYMVNGPTAIPAGGYGRATRDASTIWIKYDSGTPANGEGWGPKPGQWTASKGFPGILVKGIQSSTNTRLLGTLAPITKIIGKLAEACSVGETDVDVDIWSDTGDTTMNLNANDWLMKSGATDIASGKKVVCEFINGKWYITEAECA